jgi:hypothetical protein
MGVGIAVGVSGTLIGILVALGLIWCLRRRRHRRMANQSGSNMTEKPTARPRVTDSTIVKELKLLFNLGNLEMENENGLHQPPVISVAGDKQIMRAHYGIEKTVPFDFSVHPLPNMLVGPDGIPRCSQVMHWYAKKVRTHSFILCDLSSF